MNLFLNFETIAQLLAGQTFAPQSPGERISAAVALLLRQSETALEMLFIQRATHHLDPWSGHLAFPGGRLERGEEARQAAERETREEIGIDLDQATFLGRLPEITGMTLPVRVSCFVYGVGGVTPVPMLNEEVFATFWVGLDDLLAPERQVTATVHFDGADHQVPAIRLPPADIPVLWGLTYRMVLQFLACCLLDLPVPQEMVEI